MSPSSLMAEMISCQEDSIGDVVVYLEKEEGQRVDGQEESPESPLGWRLLSVRGEPSRPRKHRHPVPYPPSPPPPWHEG